MAFICDDCNRQGKKELAPFRVRATNSNSMADCCIVHVVGELVALLQKSEEVMVLRGEMENVYLPPPAFDG